MTWKSLAFAGLVAAAFGLAGCSGCEDGGSGGIRSSRFPDLQAAPDPLIFEVVPIGQSITHDITLKNVGGGALQVTKLDFSNSLDTREFQKTHPTLPFLIDADESVTVHVTYSPRDPGTDEGELLVESNDPQHPHTRVRIVSALSHTNLLVEPGRLDFGPVESGTSKALTVSVTNLGNVPVGITSVQLGEGTSADFKVTAGDSDLPTLSQTDKLVVEVTYTPQGRDRDTGTLVIGTADMERPQIVVPLQGEEPTPEINTSPVAINFGALDPGQEAQEPLVILNEGSAPLVVTAVGFGVAPPGVNDQFTIDGLPDDFPAQPLVLQPDEQHPLTVRYHPQQAGIHDTSVAIRSNDQDEPIYTVPIRARVKHPCIQVEPQAVDLGRVALGVESQHGQVRILNCGELPLNIQDITLDGADGFHWGPVGGASPVGMQLAPLAFAQVEVWYQNVDLMDGQVAASTLKIANDTPDDPVVPVELTVTGGGAPSCDLLVLPNHADFGLLARGSNRTRSLEVLNRGTGQCQVGQQTIESFPIPGLPTQFIVTRPLPRPVIAPGERVPIDVTYHPIVFSLGDTAKLVVHFHDPFRNEDRQAEAQLTGISGESNIEVIPEHVDFGRVTAQQCASQEERVTVYDTGLVDLCISDITFEGDHCDEFFLADRPVADMDGCINVDRSHPATVQLTYEPADLGTDDCTLVFHSNASDQPELRVPLHGEGIRESHQVDEFVQTSGQSVDILFVLDNSGSMQEEQENLARNISDFIRGAQQFQNDYQIGVVTTDVDSPDQSGKLQGNPRIMRRGPNVEQQFEQVSQVGTNGSGTEEGLEAAKRALSNPLAFDTGNACHADADCVMPDTCVEGVCGGYNRGFIRAAAALVVIFLSDEEDQSPSPLNFYVDFFKNIKGFRNEALFQAFAIVGAENGQAAACQSPNGDAEAGQRYAELAQRTHGDVYSICDDNFGASLRSIGQSAFGLPVQFFLTRPAVAATVQVTVNGQAVPGQWMYDQASNSIVFDAQHVPQAGAHIRVEYDAQCFPRHE